MHACECICFQAYKRHDPSSPEEIEYMENLFNCMCSALLCVANRERFLKGEGLQLMILMLRCSQLLLLFWKYLYISNVFIFPYYNADKNVFFFPYYNAVNDFDVRLLCYRERKLSRCPAVKVLNYAMAGAEGSDNCQKFVDILGLRSVFPLFMKTPKINKKSGPSKQQLEGSNNPCQISFVC